MRSERIYFLALCQKIGVNGRGPHKHNDWLSFDLCIDKIPVIIDPGSYCYTGNMKMRRLFRSTAYHNTVVIDGEEQLPIHNSSFELNGPKGDVLVDKWISNDFMDVLKAHHTGYARLPEPVIHNRTFILNKIKQEVRIKDKFNGRGRHTIEYNFHLDKGLHCEKGENVVNIMKGKKKVMHIKTGYEKHDLEVRDGWISRAYNKKEHGCVVSWKTYIDTEKKPVLSHHFIASEKQDD